MYAHVSISSYRILKNLASSAHSSSTHLSFIYDKTSLIVEHGTIKLRGSKTKIWKLKRSTWVHTPIIFIINIMSKLQEEMCDLQSMKGRLVWLAHPAKKRLKEITWIQLLANFLDKRDKSAHDSQRFRKLLSLPRSKDDLTRAEIFSTDFNYISQERKSKWSRGWWRCWIIQGPRLANDVLGQFRPSHYLFQLIILPTHTCCRTIHH